MTPSGLSVRHLPSPTSETPVVRAGPMVRTPFPPAVSHTNLPVATDIGSPHGNGAAARFCDTLTELADLLAGLADAFRSVFAWWRSCWPPEGATGHRFQARARART